MSTTCSAADVAPGADTDGPVFKSCYRKSCPCLNGFARDDLLSVESLRKIKRLAIEHEAEIWVHHDPDDHATRRILPEHYAYGYAYFQVSLSK